MRDEKISDFLARLADRVPAPGGGTAAALHAAQAAALLGMVARYSTGGKYAEHQLTIERIITETDELRSTALQLAEGDAAAFTAVTDAYKEGYQKVPILFNLPRRASHRNNDPSRRMW